MIIWGTRGKVVKLDPGPSQFCANCGQQRSFSYWLQYKLFHIWYLIRFVTSKKYLLACDVCERGAPVDTQQAQHNIHANPIGWFDRFGWAIPLGAVMAFFGSAFVVGQFNDRNDGEMAAHPQVGDLYVLDLAVNNPNRTMRNMYALGRVSEVTGDQVKVELSQNYHDRFFTVQTQIKDHAYNASGFFSDSPRSYTSAELGKMYDDDAIVDVERPGAD